MSSSTHDDVATAPGRLVEVADGVHAYVQPDGSWWINNTGLLVGRHGAVSVDSCSTERRTRAYLEAIASVTDAPVRTLVNTHHHGDHTHGNWLFPGATIVGHEGTRREVLAAGHPNWPGIWEPVEWGEIVLAPPFLTYTEGVDLWVDDLRCEVRHVGVAAHTTNDSIVWLPEQRVLFAGDLLFHGGTPFLVMGSVTGAIRVCEEVLRPLGATTIIPGHGEVAGPELIDDVLGYLRFVERIAREGERAGLSPLELARRTDLGPYAEWLDRERLVGNLHRAYAELRGAAPGAPIDVPGAVREMVEFNGGRPLSCHA
ncbi:MBL fold metallo-hydrolase [Pseudonocardia sp. RS010]|uniref:MBL fold metallo-hydrolase n=1 Tax=Pseudonocardia sp. RS010 TaxID=3385979 RepID=UPI0039A03A64